jgi:hypothetical protein
VLWSTAKRRALRAGLEFSIHQKDVVIPKKCPVFGIPLRMGIGKRGPNSPSLDRIDNNFGYVPGNVHVISWRANSIKGDASIKELEKLVGYLRKYMA